jgi:hypothetical protein
MRRHLSLFAACTVLLAWSGPVNAQDRTFGGYDCMDDGYAAGYRWTEKWQITDTSEYLWTSNSFHEGCTEDPERGADEDDESVDEPIDEGRYFGRTWAVCGVTARHAGRHP